MASFGPALQNIRLITFDVIGTLIQFREPPTMTYTMKALNNRLKVDHEAMTQNFFKVWKEMEKQHPHFGATTNMSSLKWWMTVVKTTMKSGIVSKVSDEKIQEMASELFNYFHTCEPYEIYPDAYATIHRLTAANEANRRMMKVGLISNFDNRLHDLVGQLGLRAHVDFVVTSEDARSSKPEAEIFKLALEMSGLKGKILRNQILHVGDDIEKDYFGARRQGWNSLLVDRERLEFPGGMPIPRYDTDHVFVNHFWGVKMKGAPAPLASNNHVIRDLEDIFVRCHQ